MSETGHLYQRDVLMREWVNRLMVGLALEPLVFPFPSLLPHTLTTASAYLIRIGWS